MCTQQHLAVSLLLFGLVLSIVVNAPVATLYATQTVPNDLGEVEITEYEGKDLSSIDAFRENSISGPQYIDGEAYRLIIKGLVNNELEYTYDDIISNHQSYKKVATLNCVEGWNVTILWEGVLIEDLIEAAEVNPEATTVIFYAYDGYSTSLPLDAIINKDIILAYKMNNLTLPPERGYPFELVAESKWGYKWIKWINTIILSDDDEYQGYWESRGYSNTGNLGEQFFDFGNTYDTYPDIDNTIPEFQSWMVLPIFVVTTFFVAIFRKKLFRFQN